MKRTVLVLMLASVVSAGAIDVRKDSFAAIAYSPGTGRYVYAANLGNRKAAEAVALKNCGTADAKIVCWVSYGFIALALGDDRNVWGAGWAFGGGSNAKDAADKSAADCATKTKGAHPALVVSSDGQFVFDQNDHRAGIDSKGNSKDGTGKVVSPNPASTPAPKPGTSPKQDKDKGKPKK